ncbi:hypothetical protein D9756_004542 [Leucocoprinus leucothites]|uniref:HNH nuclease domain-containing protein n=1 Tax=Leucocoprinus leucothites TaxID=201217 RepID=A0A8H5G8T8_9AGAR|nr:hypothetical protein D9756_004542 [Leucoagaricus leucothites]
MTPLPVFQLPLQAGHPPLGYESPSVSEPPSANRERDVFLGRQRCLVCGIFEATCNSEVLHRCCIASREFWLKWNDLKRRGWIPFNARRRPYHEPRNMLSLCPSHREYLEGYRFFIRFIPQAQKFVFINYSGIQSLQKFHGKAIPLDIREPDTPFPSVFILHEMRVRGTYPFRPAEPDIPEYQDITWQEWVLSEDLFDNVTGLFRRDRPPGFRYSDEEDVKASTEVPVLQCLGTTIPQGSPSHDMVNADNGVVDEILQATWELASWRACVQEGEARARVEAERGAKISEDSE